MHVRLSLAYQLQVRRQRTGIDENFYCALAKTEKVPNEQKMKEDVTWGPKRNECVISCMRAGYQKQTCNKERGQVRERKLRALERLRFIRETLAINGCGRE